MAGGGPQRVWNVAYCTNANVKLYPSIPEGSAPNILLNRHIHTSNMDSENFNCICIAIPCRMITPPPKHLCTPGNSPDPVTLVASLLAPSSAVAVHSQVLHPALAAAPNTFRHEWLWVVRLLVSCHLENTSVYVQYLWITMNNKYYIYIRIMIDHCGIILVNYTLSQWSLFLLSTANIDHGHPRGGKDSAWNARGLISSTSRLSD